MPNEFHKVIRVGTRESKLARLQTDLVIDALKSKFPSLEFEIIAINTGGDKVLNKPIAELGFSGVFVKELEEALLENEVDLVVHSLKDLPTDLPAGLCLAAVLDRADPRDVLVSRNNVHFDKLPPGSKVATSSRRRKAQLLSIRDDLEFIDIRGNLPTRLQKQDQGLCEAMVLAAAGLVRLQLHNRITEYFEPEICMPAAGQGALAIECRQNDHQTLVLVEQIEDRIIRAQITAERTFLDALGGGCSVPIGDLCQTNLEGLLKLSGCVAALDGSSILKASEEAPLNKAAYLGKHLAEIMIEIGADEVLESLRKSAPNAISAP